MLAIIDTPIYLGLLLVFVPFVVLPIWFTWKALDRAGLGGSLALLWLVPFGAPIVLGVLAFANWPNLPRKITDLPIESGS